MYTDFWLLNGYHPSLAQPPWPTHAGLWRKPRLFLGEKLLKITWIYTPWSKQMVFTSQKESDISSNNQSQPTWVCIWNHMKYKQQYTYIKSNWQLLKDADQHSSRNSMSKMLSPLVCLEPGHLQCFYAWEKWVTLHWQIKCVRSCEFIERFCGHLFNLFFLVVSRDTWME